MKRVVYARRGGLEAIEIIDEEDPKPADNQVRIEVHRAGINFADLMMRQGLYGAAPDFPFTPDKKSQATSVKSVKPLVIFLLVIVWSHSQDLVAMRNR